MTNTHLPHPLYFSALVHLIKQSNYFLYAHFQSNGAPTVFETTPLTFVFNSDGFA